jgi:ferredoxin/NAD(P)H-dependent FMN reductase
VKRILLKYFSGTGNSLRVLEMCSTHFQENEYDAVLSSITESSKDDYSSAELIGFCFPVYAFSLPRICKRFLQSLPTSTQRTKVFLLVTAGVSDESGFALDHGRKILANKGYDVVYSDVVEMPVNWITFENPPAKDVADTVIANGEQKALDIAQSILNAAYYHHPFNIPERTGYVKMYVEYMAFHYIGIHQMWRMFRVNSSCNSCGVCEKLCPTNSIALNNGTPCWHASCEQCMRCVNFCSKQAIFQIYVVVSFGK